MAGMAGMAKQVQPAILTLRWESIMVGNVAWLFTAVLHEKTHGKTEFVVLILLLTGFYMLTVTLVRMSSKCDFFLFCEISSKCAFF